ncbi:MAG: NAD(P)-dependent oxidoreductase [Candidatus Omnitrophica bacterium]|nr:NAD(P)-dependent oxidoreductase [Candidatus Omnitrophota bacterium]
MKKRVLVTGAAGFLGQHLLKNLKNQRWQVTGTYLGGIPQTRYDHVTYVPLNILNSRDVVRLFESVKPDWVFHLAALTIPRDSWNNIEGTFQANVRGTLNILEGARLQDFKPRIFFASTIQVYGQSFRANEALDERGTLWPDSPYAASKAVAELAILDYAKKFKVEAVIGRFANSVGCGQPAALVFPQWCRQISQIELSQATAELATGNLEVYRDFLHAQDTANAMLVIMRKGRAGQVYNVASGKTEKLKNYAQFLIQQSSKKIKLISQAGLRRKNEPRKMSVQVGKLKDLGWHPDRSVEDGLQDLLRECRQSGEKK